MLWTYLLYFFVTFFSKAILALVVCWLIIPTARSCDACDCETLPVRMGPVGRGASWLLGGRLQRRWCPRCRWEGLARTGRGKPAAVGEGAGRSLPDGRFRA